MKKLLIVMILLAAAGSIAVWQVGRASSKPHPELSAKMTFDYNGPLDGLFQQVTAKSGAKYHVAPAIAKLPIQVSFKERDALQIQSEVGKKVKVQYRPPPPGSDEVQVLGK